jgi:hypothetical protein
MYSLALIIFVVSEKKAFEHFPLGPNVNLCIAVVAILVGSRDHRTQIWKGAIQGSFHKSLVAIGPVVSEEKIITNGQNCSILSQKVPKFELYNHNDELFNIYYGIFYEL